MALQRAGQHTDHLGVGDYRHGGTHRYQFKPAEFRSGQRFCQPGGGMAVLKDWAGRMCGGGGNARRTFGDGSRRRTSRPDGNHTYKNDRFCRRIRQPLGEKVAENRRISSYVQKKQKILPIYPKCGMQKGIAVINNGAVASEAGASADTGAPPRNRRLRTFAIWCRGPRRHGAGTTTIGQGGSKSHWFHRDRPPRRRRHGT